MPRRAGHHPSAGQNSEMLSLAQQPSTSTHSSANVLPCRIHHSGHVSNDARYWHPYKEDDSSGDCIAYFRGRKLRGRELKIPPGYRGALLHKTNRVIKDDTVGKEAVEELESQRDSMIDTSYEAEKYALRRALQSGELDGGEMTVMEESGSFQSVTVWGHESTPKTGEDPYIRGIKEWMSFAAALHSSDETDPNPHEDKSASKPTSPNG